MSAVAIIPARGGSKRIPRKNIRDFCGQPIIAWSIQAAIDSECFERVVVSTDDDEIAAVARACGAETPFLRPAALADDHTATIPVIQHAIERLEADGTTPARVCCIYATAPFITAADLRGAGRLHARVACDFVLPVAAFASPIQRALRITANDRLEMFQPHLFTARSQDLEPAYHDAGQFYWGRTAAWLSGQPLFSPGSTAYPLPRFRVQDIDTPEDWQHAELLFRALDGSDTRTNTTA